MSLGITAPRSIPPASWQQSIPANTRRTVTSKKFTKRFRVKRFRPSFALNTQRNLRLSVWITDGPLTADGARPAGRNLMPDRGGVDYIVGDGEEGEKDVLLNAIGMAGEYVAVECYNVDATNAHTLDALVEFEEIG